MGRSYDPWGHAQQIGLTIVERPMPPTVNGLYVHARRLVTLRPNLSARSARCTLAHEIQHALAGDKSSSSAHLHRKAELLASRRTSWMLIDPYEYAQAEREHDGHQASMAHALNVTVKVLRDWQAMIRQVVA